MRVEDAEEGVGEFRKLVVDLMMHPRCQESKSLQQALDMGSSHLPASSSKRLAIFGYLTANSAPLCLRKASSRS